MSKEELIQELTDINCSFVNNISVKLTDLSERFNKFTSKYDKVYSELNSHLLTKIIQLEHNADTNSAEIHEDVLEESICKALSLQGLTLFLRICTLVIA